MREVCQEDLNTFLDEFILYLVKMVSVDTFSKMGCILAIVKCPTLVHKYLGRAVLFKSEVERFSNCLKFANRFGNYLRNNCSANFLDLSVIELATKAIARLTQVSGTYTANLNFDIIDHEVKEAFEWLSVPERNEGLDK